MKKLLTLFAFLLAAQPALADFTGKDAAGSTITFFNTATCTAATCKPQNQLIDSAGAEVLGTVTASPTANTIGARLKSVNDTLTTGILVTPGTATGAAVSAFALRTGINIGGNLQGITGLTVGSHNAQAVAVVNSAGTQLSTFPVSVASGQIASGAVASGAYASGSIASGAFASGSLAAGAMVDLLTVIGTKNNGTAATNSLLAGGVYNSSPLTLTNTQQSSLQLTSAGYLQVNVANTNANGQATMANSSPVAIASNQSNIPTINGGNLYETVAASQTAQVLGPTGATGDYLSHCVIYPTSTTPGVVTVFDNTNAAGTNVIAFPGGASSVSNLAPISIPVGALSTAGAWKVTTGANLVVTCYGKFT